MSQKTKTTTSDLVMGVILLLFGIYLVIDALGMKIYNSFLDAPGFFPFILGMFFWLRGDDVGHPLRMMEQKRRKKLSNWIIWRFCLRTKQKE